MGADVERKNYHLGPEAVTKYLHCGSCWRVIGKISASEADLFFDTFDCSWPCECGRLNLSSDGVGIRRDARLGIHYFYMRDGFEEKRVQSLKERFDFDTGTVT
jgi:hypothetical protein